MLLAAAGGAAGQTPATQPRGLVEVTVSGGDEPQPAAGPIGVEVKLKNVSDAPVRWWSGGPDTYPAVEHFAVEIRYAENEDWEAARPTNGQYSQGSGTHYEIKRGESIVVPMAIPIGRGQGVHVRVTPQTWRAAKPAECYVAVMETHGDDQRYVQARRARMIEAALEPREHFWHHVTVKYGDATVIDALLKLVTIDNPIIAARAAKLLAARDALPEAAGSVLAPLLAQALARDAGKMWDDLRYNLLRAGLITQSESIRGLAIEVLAKDGNPSIREMIAYELARSPGDEAWLQRIRTAVLGMADGAADARLRAAGQRNFDLVERRLKALERSEDAAQP
ncbi:MAG: hypothetical protein WBD40_00260 [Tepidisphaeraceae bacterium]